MSKKTRIFALFAAISFLTCGCYFNTKEQSQSSNQQQITTKVGGLSSKEYTKLANLNFKSGDKPIVFINRNNSTLNKNWVKNRIDYQNLDSWNRTSASVTAFLDENNLITNSQRTRQIWKPTGWHSNRPGAEIYNRGHLIAYSLSNGINKNGVYTGNASGDLDNPKNLFTQTAFSNQKLQTYYERQVREALYSGQKVIYQATPIFRGDEKMARGINLQAISTNGMLNFNVYLFNVQPGYKFNYQTGQAIKDNTMKINQIY
ncbi:DNA/RNA non-specific endonuclease [Lactobacillus taiwanensis]|uniref:DNA/RNA non-specific endonuclease n=1 Tax=Lactobacillus taiwanensis TaxID=508451 RepID=UPI0025B1CD8B|nr:DNA/RNA non-specific endonuclease [Lactobacillus taiwanensis]